MSFPYKNPVSPTQIIGTESVSRDKTFGTNFSVLSVGGFMEINSLENLYYTTPPLTTGPINYTGNTIPITFSLSDGNPFSFDTLTLNSDNISSGRKKLGMLVYVREEEQIYQFNINNYDNLWNAATGATGVGGSTVIMSEFGTIVKANTPEGIAFISGWTSNTIDGISGETQSTAVWKKYYGNNLSITGGTYSSGTLTLTNITGGTVSVTGFSGGGGGDRYTTGFTYNNNTFTLIDNSGNTLSATINDVTGLTVNGDLIVTGNSYLNTVTASTITNVDYIDFDITQTGTTSSPGRLFWDAGNRTLSLGMLSGVTQQIGEEQYYLVENQTSGTLLDGYVVRAAGTSGSSGKILIDYTIANGTIPAFYTLGVLTQTLLSGETGYVTSFGLVRNIDTTGTPYGETWSQGDVLYVSTTILGGFTNVKPIVPNQDIIIAIVMESGVNGSIFVRPDVYRPFKDPQLLTVAKQNADFTSIKDAVDSIVGSSISNRYVIDVGPGIFVEDEIDLTSTPYVSIVGSNIQTTLVVPSGSTQHVFKIGISNEISFLSISGASTGYAGIYCYDVGDFAQAHKVSMYDCDTNIWIESNTQDTKFYGEYVDFNGQYEYGVRCIGNNGFLALANMENYFNFPTGSNITYCNYATGSGATINAFVSDNVSNGVSGTTAFYIQDGADLNISTVTSDGNTYGIRNPNIGLPVTFDVDGASFVNGEWDLYVERIGTFGTLGGSSNHQKIFTVSEDVYWAFLDIDDGEFDITRKASVTFTDGSHTDFTTLIFEGGTMGLLSGGSLTTISGFTVQADGGFGYLEKSDNSGIVRRIDWINNQITLSANTDNYIYINENSNLVSSGTRPITSYNIVLGRVVTDSTGVEFIDLSPMKAEHTSNSFDSLFTMALGPIYAFGSIVTEGATPFTLDVTMGDYHFSTNQYMPMGGTGITFTQYYRNGTGTTWVTSATTLVNNTQYDNNGTLTGLTTGYFTKHTLYTLGQGALEHYFLVIGQNEYSTLVEAEDALLTTPPSYFTDGVTQIANIYIQEGTSGITQVEDIRPTIGFRAGGVNASSVHGNLLGLNADDHTQYLLVSGARAMSGNLDMGANNITNVGTVDGVTVSAHATRHQFGGLDPVGSTTPSANAIPYADVSGTLNDWISTASTSNYGKVKTSSSSTTVLSDNDNRFLKSFTGGTYSDTTKTLTLTTVDGTTYPITGFQDIFVTGGTYSNGTTTFTNNSGGTFNVTGFFSGDSTPYLALSGGTVTGNTIFTQGLTANTFSGTSIVVNTVNSTNNTLTESNGDLRVAWSDGHLFNSGVLKLDWNNGYLYSSTNLISVDWEYMQLYDTNSTVLAIDWKNRNLVDSSGNIKFNWETGVLTGLTQIETSTINATTYQNLPTDVRVTGGTYNNSTGTATFTNNTGGTFNVTGFSTGGTGSDTYVTGLTYSANVLTLSQNGGQPNLTATIGLKTKSGSVSAASFTGTPRKATVTFATAYPTTNYSIGITGVNNRTYTYESKTTTSFVINTNANTALTGDVDWQTIEYGES